MRDRRRTVRLVDELGIGEIAPDKGDRENPHE